MVPACLHLVMLRISTLKIRRYDESSYRGRLDERHRNVRVGLNRKKIDRELVYTSWAQL